ncbi:YceI family protein [Chitinophaga tropicalis]|uniref:Lipid/polyisoprenoid-binding YceI-like domain-containing protein n=1 Tax=Chitinophaga tropicalis TaxID=2683588 RepID=A0A7K1UDF8_9BACT|nr:YceI family protein [Chitinophaga tropicalis]MVT12411.1 hypothetical protein [Chitinophaga tropicalis]
MKTVMKTVTLLLLILLSGYVPYAQQRNDFNLSLSGTSTMHDWEMKSSKMACNATFTFYDDGDLGGLTQLNFVMPVESLKGDRTGMDANAYRTLNTSKYPTITFNLTSATVSPDGKIIRCNGKLTVAGVTRDIDLVANAKVNSDKSLNVKGSKTINMTDFEIEPPTFLMGAFKTGDEVKISFDLTFRH